MTSNAPARYNLRKRPQSAVTSNNVVTEHPPPIPHAARKARIAPTEIIPTLPTVVPVPCITALLAEPAPPTISLAPQVNTTLASLASSLVTTPNVVDDMIYIHKTGDVELSASNLHAHETTSSPLSLPTDPNSTPALFEGSTPKTLCMNKQLVQQHVNVVFYHRIRYKPVRECADGLYAAFMVWFAHKERVQHIEWIPMLPGRAPFHFDPTGKHICMLDVSCDLETAQRWHSKAASLLIIDHHESAIKTFGNGAFPSECLELDDRWSGAWLATRFFFPSQPIPDIIRMVSERDTWIEHRSADVDAFYKGTRNWPRLTPTQKLQYRSETQRLMYKFEQMERLLHEPELVQERIRAGHAILEETDDTVEDAVAFPSIHLYDMGPSENPKHVQYVLAGGVGNTTGLQTEIGHQLLQEYPLLDVAYIYSHNDSDNTTSISFRARKGEYNAEPLAKSLSAGGGGHAAACASRVPGKHSIIPKKLVKMEDVYELLQRATIQPLRNHSYGGVILPKVVTLNCTSNRRTLALFLQRKHQASMVVTYRCVGGMLEVVIVLDAAQLTCSRTQLGAALFRDDTIAASKLVRAFPVSKGSNIIVCKIDMSAHWHVFGFSTPFLAML